MRGPCSCIQSPTLILPMKVHCQHLDTVLKSACTHIPFPESSNELVSKFPEALKALKEARMHT